MSKQSVTPSEIEAIFRDVLEVDVPEDADGLLEDGRIDSLTLVDLLLELEERYGVEFSADDLDPDHFASLETIAELVDDRRGEA